MYEGPHTVAAVILETITGTNGIIVPPDGYLQSIREVCDRYGILLIADEVMAGFGRTGKWFAVEHWDESSPTSSPWPRASTRATCPWGRWSCRRPISAACGRRVLRRRADLHSGHPGVACAAAVASIEAFQEEGIVENAARTGERLALELGRLAERHPSVGEVRGLGCFFGLELVKDRATREPLVPFNGGGEAARPAAALAARALANGLYLMTHWNIVMVCPPLTITPEELEEGISLLDDAPRGRRRVRGLQRAGAALGASTSDVAGADPPPVASRRPCLIPSPESRSRRTGPSAAPTASRAAALPVTETTTSSTASRWAPLPARCARPRRAGRLDRRGRGEASDRRRPGGVPTALRGPRRPSCRLPPNRPCASGAKRLRRSTALRRRRWPRTQ